MKLQLCILFALFTVTVSVAQKIKIKKGIVYVDGEKCLTVDGDPNNVSIYNLEGEELVFLKFIHNTKYADTYNKITFLDSKLSFTSKSYIFTKKLLIKKLLASKTIVNCELVEEKVERFVLKYDEDVEKDEISVKVIIDRN